MAGYSGRAELGKNHAFNKNSFFRNRSDFKKPITLSDSLLTDKTFPLQNLAVTERINFPNPKIT